VKQPRGEELDLMSPSLPEERQKKGSEFLPLGMGKMEAERAKAKTGPN